MPSDQPKQPKPLDPTKQSPKNSTEVENSLSIKKFAATLIAAGLIGIGGCSDPKIEKQRESLELHRRLNVAEVENQARGKIIEFLKKAGIESGASGKIILIIVKETGAKFNSTTQVAITPSITGKMVFNNEGNFYKKVAKSDVLFNDKSGELKKYTQFVFILPQSKKLTEKEMLKLKSYFPNNQVVGDVDIREREDNRLEFVITAEQVQEMMKKNQTESNQTESKLD